MDVWEAQAVKGDVNLVGLRLRLAATPLAREMVHFNNGTSRSADTAAVQMRYKPLPRPYQRMGNPERCIQGSHAKYQPYGGRFVSNPIHVLEDRLLRL